MPTHTRERPARGRRRPLGYRFASFERCESTPNPNGNQTGLLTSPWRQLGDITSDILELPVENFVCRPMRPSERSLVVACWWRMRREGVKLPAEPGVIVIEGGQS